MGSFIGLFLREYHLRNLLRVQQLLDFTSLDHLVLRMKEWTSLTKTTTQHLTYIRLAINEEVERRSSSVARKIHRERNKLGHQDLIIGGFTDALLDHATFNKIARSELVRSTVPNHILRYIKPPTISYKYGDSLKNTVGNEHCFSRMSLEDIRKVANGRCCCHHDRYAPFCHEELGHVATCDPSVVGGANLEKCLDLGLKHRFEFAPDQMQEGQEDLPLVERLKQMMRTAVAKYIDRLTEWLLKKHNVVAILKNYKACLSAKLGEALDAIVYKKYHERLLDVPEAGTGLTLKDTDLSHLRKLQRHFVFLETDKSSQDVAIVCKPMYAKCLISELENGNTYTKVEDESPKEIISRHNSKIKGDFSKFLTGKTYEDVARFKGSLKFHKSPPKLRYIAGSGVATMKPVSCLLNFIFGKLHPTVEKIWTSTFRSAGLKSEKSWIVSNTSEAATMLKRLNQRHTPQDLSRMLFETHDFSTLYTNLPHKDLIKRLSSLIDRIFAKVGNNSIRYSISGGRLDFCNEPAQQVGIAPPKKKGAVFFRYATAHDLKQLLSYLIQNTYVRLGETVFKQDIGIPIGTNCAVWLANWYLFTYELDFVERLIRMKRTKTLEYFNVTARYIDDVLSGGNPLFQEYAVLENKQINGENVGIYPKFLTLNRESGPAHAVHFLDVSLFYSKRSKRFETTIYSKTADPKFAKLRFIKYAHMTSKLTKRAKMNTITSQFYRYVRICSARRFFKYWMSKLIYDLILRGYKPRRCLNTLRQVAKKYMRERQCYLYCITSVDHLIRLIRSRIRRFFFYKGKLPPSSV